MKKIITSFILTGASALSFGQTVFVDKDAAGNNDGTSWANAYTTLQAAEDNAPNGAEIWVADGVYSNDPNNRATRILIIESDHDWYGGFNGTETQLSQRDPDVNLTVLNGDGLGNGHATAADVADNAYNLVRISADVEVKFDGFTFQEAHGNGSPGNDQGGVFQFDANANGAAMTPKLEVVNCTLKDNYANKSALFAALESGAVVAEYELSFDRCKFIDNRGFYEFQILRATANTTLVDRKEISFTNCLWDGNTSSTSEMFYINFSTSKFLEVSWVNNTFVNTTFNGEMISIVNNSSLQTADLVSFYNNVAFISVPGTQSFTNASTAMVGANNIGDFILFGANNQTTGNTFNDFAQGDYSLSSTSQALDAGSDAYLSDQVFTEDLIGNPRFIGPIDAGAYETMNCALYDLTANSTTVGTLKVSWSDYNHIDSDFDLTVVPTGQAQSTGTPITGVTTATYTFTGLTAGASYDVYIDYTCFGQSSSGTSMVSGTVVDPVYVDIDATGNNDGSSWANAFTNLNTAVSSSPAGSQFWVAEGAYTNLTTGDRDLAALTLTDAAQIYGGFNGTETARTARNPQQNPTIITGDINGDDVAGNFTSNRTDNLYRVVQIEDAQTNFLLDGFTIRGGHADVTTDHETSRGAAFQVYMTAASQNITGKIKNCIIEDNHAEVSTAYYVFAQVGSGHVVDIEFESCRIQNNSAPNILAYFRADASFKDFSSVVNSLVADNTTNTELFLLNSGAAANLKIDFINNSIVNNTATNHVFRLINTNNCQLKNNVFSNNGVNTISKEMNLVSGSIQTANNFGNTSAQGNTVLTPNSFVDYNNGVYQLVSTSNAVDAADASLLSDDIIKDIDGNDRIYNNLLDAGAFEYQILPDLVKPNAVGQNITVSLNAFGNAMITASQIDNGSTDNQTLVADLVLGVAPSTFSCADIGTNTVVLTVTDEAGNTDTAHVVVTVEDNTAPIINANLTQTVALDASGAANLTVAMVENGSSDNCGIATQVLSATSFDCSDLGAQTISYTVTDNEGNSSTENIAVQVVDLIAPVAVGQNITLDLNATGSATLTTAQIENGSSDNCGIASSSLSQTNFTCNDLGTNTIDYMVADAAGNSHTTSIVVTVEDNTAPTLSAQNQTLSLDANGNLSISEADLNVLATDYCSGVTVSLSSTSFDCTDLGVNQVVVTASDLNGNTTNTTVDVTVVDNTAPVITANIAQTLTLDASGNAVLTVAMVENGTTDNCGVNTSSLSETNFTCADLGVNTVVYTVTDNAGNIATETITVTVTEAELPTVITQDITVSLDVNGNVIISTSDIDNGSSDNCGIAAMSLDLTSFDCSDIGTQTVTLTVTDNAGNAANVTAQVTIVDNQIPTVVTQDLTIYLDANGEASLQSSDVDNGSNDNCGIASMSLDQTLFDCSNIGQNTVTLTVIDNQGNSANGTATITVVDDIAPSLQATDISLDIYGLSSVSITENDVVTNAVDNCLGVPTITLSQDNFTAVGVYPVDVTATDDAGNSTTATINVTVFTTLAVEEEAFDFNIYPNPTSGIVFLATTVNVEELKVYNSVGELMMSFGAVEQIDLSALAPGTYFIEMRSDKAFVTKAIVKR